MKAGSPAVGIPTTPIARSLAGKLGGSIGQACATIERNATRYLRNETHALSLMLARGLNLEPLLTNKTAPVRRRFLEIYRLRSQRIYFGSFWAKISILCIVGGFASSSPAFAINAAATLPFKCAVRPASSLNVSKMANDEGPS